MVFLNRERLSERDLQSVDFFLELFEFYADGFEELRRSSRRLSTGDKFQEFISAFFEVLIECPAKTS